MFNVRLAGGHLYGKQLFNWLSLVVSFMTSFVLSFFPLDVLDGIWDLTESVSEGFLTYSFKGAAMNLRDRMTNSQEVLNEIPTHDRANRENMKVLRLTWFVEEDCLAINSQIKDEHIVSKRTVLRQTASVYEPLGLHSSVTLRGKLFLQGLWNQKIAWDKHLSERDRNQWYGIHEDLKLLANCQFPRHIGLDKKGSTKYQFSAMPQYMHSQQQSTYSKNVKISAELTSSSQKQGLYQIRKSQFHVESYLLH